jgi:hypothetical protein
MTLSIDEIAKRTGRSREEVVEVACERAAIREYLGGLSRAEAEKLSLVDALDVLGESR